MTSVERTAYPVFSRLVLARDLHVFYTLSPDELEWARAKTDTDEHLLALALALKCFQKMGRLTRDAEVPEAVVEHVRRCLELDERVRPVYTSLKTRESHRVLIRRRDGVERNPGKARKIAARGRTHAATRSTRRSGRSAAVSVPWRCFAIWPIQRCGGG